MDLRVCLTPNAKSRFFPTPAPSNPQMQPSNMNEIRNSGQNRAFRIASLALMLTALTAGPARAVNWTMNHFDAERDGANLNETVLTPAANNV
jgi:hypothetical protein